MPRPLSSPIDRFDAFALPEPNSGCWIWMGYIQPNGYGRLLIKEGDEWYGAIAHRFSYERFVGEIPRDLVIDHKCRNRACVNPDHLRLLTRGENVLCGEGLAAKNKAKTHCPHGHEYTSENTEISSSGRRKCRICRRESCRRQRAKK